MPLVNFSNLDFDQIKTSIQDYLRANSNFTDYDYEGSNLSTIIDVLAYNTYITSYNANMVSNEVFIDSATLRDNVVSLARNIGYVPRSRKASTSNISFFVDVSSTTATSVTLKAGIALVTSSRFRGQNFTFIVPEDITVPVDSTGTATFDDINVYEGSYLTQSFTVSSRNPDQKFILSNSGIDTSLINIVVKDSQTSTVQRTFTQANSLFDITSSSPIYFIQEVSDERYEVLFGDGVFGIKLEEPNYVQINYNVCSGSEANNLSDFRFAGILLDNNGASITNGVSLITTNTPSYGGAEIESTESIKKYSTQIYSSQNRAVTSNDYNAIVPKIYPETESVSSFGGEVLSPPAYGKVFISIKPYNGSYLSSTIKSNIINSLKQYSVAGIVPVIVDLKYLYIEVNTSVYYNTNLTPSGNDVKTLVSENITNYSNSSELNKFGARFKYSKLLKVIDDSDTSITSDITTINIRRDLEPILNSFAEYEICYGNRFHIKNETGYNIKSSGFVVSGISDTVYLGDLPNTDMRTGSVFLFKLDAPNEPVVVKKSIGTIDYIKGEIKLNPINIISTSVVSSIPLIEISVNPYSNDVIGLQDLYLQLDSTSTVINMVPDNIASGNDTSGSNYVVTSSYSNGSLTR